MARVPRLLLAIVRPFREFFRTQAAGGALLIVASALALAWANSRYAETYHGLLDFPVTLSFGGRGISWPLHHWINDALMSVFFLVAGMEIKRELLVGELRTFSRATLPLMAALGGMLVPAAIHALFNHGGPAARGWGIPMATDIAFALGCVALVSQRVPSSLVVFLMALAIFDDLGAIIVIALFYGGHVNAGALGVAAMVTAVLAAMTRLGVTRVWPFLLVGVALWIAVLQSGIHTTIAGVILGLCIPARARRTPSEILGELDRAIAQLRNTKQSELDAAGPLGALERHLESVQPPLDRMVHRLNTWVAFLIVPLFAVANAGVTMRLETLGAAASPPALGVFLGLLLGKPTGVFLATWIAVKAGLSPKPSEASWHQIVGIAALAGVGFTMSIFVTTLAFPGHSELQNASKIGIFGGSLASAVIGLVLLRVTGRVQPLASTEPDIRIVMDLPKFAEGFEVRQWEASGPFVGKTLRELDLRRRFDVSVLGVHAVGSEGVEPMAPDTPIEESSVVLLVGKPPQIALFFRAAAPIDSRSGEYGSAFPSIRPSAE